MRSRSSHAPHARSRARRMETGTAWRRGEKGPAAASRQPIESDSLRFARRRAETRLGQSPNDTSWPHGPGLRRRRGARSPLRPGTNRSTSCGHHMNRFLRKSKHFPSQVAARCRVWSRLGRGPASRASGAMRTVQESGARERAKQTREWDDLRTNRGGTNTHRAPSDAKLVGQTKIRSSSERPRVRRDLDRGASGLREPLELGCSRTSDPGQRQGRVPVPAPWGQRGAAWNSDQRTSAANAPTARWALG